MMCYIQMIPDLRNIYIDPCFNPSLAEKNQTTKNAYLESNYIIRYSTWLQSTSIKNANLWLDRVWFAINKLNFMHTLEKW